MLWLFKVLCFLLVCIFLKVVLFVFGLFLIGICVVIFLIVGVLWWWYVWIIFKEYECINGVVIVICVLFGSKNLLWLWKFFKKLKI